MKPQSPENSGEINSAAELRGINHTTLSGLFDLQISGVRELKFESHE